MPFQRAGKLGDMPEGSLTEAIFGDRPVAICHVEGKLHAIEGTCPHRGAPLGHGALHGHMVVCPYHGWEFDCRNGAYDVNPNLHLATFPVEVRSAEGGEAEVWVNLPEPVVGYDLSLDK